MFKFFKFLDHTPAVYYQFYLSNKIYFQRNSKNI